MNKPHYSRRDFLITSGVAVVSTNLPAMGKVRPAKTGKTGDLDLHAMIQPVPRSARLILDDWYVWGASMTRTDDGRCHLLYSRWPRELGHHAWLTHSEIACATADNPLGPYAFQSVALPGKGGTKWVTDMTHNPTVLRVGKEYYLYFCAARRVGTLPPGPVDPHGPHHQPTRMTQRIGVAVADHPLGPWKRIDKALIDVTLGSHDHYFTTNPSVAACPDGTFLMVYKCMDQDKRIVHGVAVAKHPLGPFKKDPHPILTHATLKFPAEDPFIWYQDDRFYGIFKDMRGTYTGARNSLALFECKDGHHWKLAAHPLVSTRTIRWADGTTQELTHLERPQLWRENGIPAVLFCAADENRVHSFNIHIPLR